MEKFSREQIEVIKKWNKEYYSLIAPKAVFFPDMWYFNFPENDIKKFSILKLEQRLNDKFDSWKNKVLSMPTTDAEKKERKKKLSNFLIETNSALSKETDNRPHVEDAKRLIGEWDDYPLNLPEHCIQESINKLERLISEMPVERVELRELFKKYIDIVRDTARIATLAAGSYNHVGVFNDLKDKQYIDGDVNSWIHYFAGTKYTNIKKIDWNKPVSELYYFIENYSPKFKCDNGQRKLNELRQIFKTTKGQIDSNTTATTKKDKQKTIDNILKENKI